MNNMMKLLGVTLLCMVMPAGICLANPHVSHSRISTAATPQGEYVVYIKQDGKWLKQGEIACDRFFRSHELALKVKTQTKAFEVRIEQKGGGIAHLDSVLINGKSPKSVAKQSKGVLKKLMTKDFDVIDATGKSFELSFNVADAKSVKLVLTGRVEGERISKIPFHYPLANLFRPMNESSQFYDYRLGSSKGALKLDGDIAREALGKPLFHEFYPSGSGHPSGTTYGWVRDDGKNLYVAMDFTADNTMDGNEDYAKVYVKTASGLKEYKVSMAEQAYGKPAFTYTDKVAYQHKTYEFAIPLNELGLDKAQKDKGVQLAFATYGTATPGVYNTVAAYDPVHNHYLVAYDVADAAANYDIYGQLVNGNGALIGATFPIAADPASSQQRFPAIAYDVSNGRYLVAWTDFRNGNYDVYGQLVNADGSLNGANFAISTAASSQGNPTIAYDTANGRYLVVWDDSRNGNTDIYGQLVNANGTLNGANFAMTTDVYAQNDSAIAWDAANSRYLVAWSDLRNGNNDIYGQLVNADGTLNGGNFAISTDANTQVRPSIAWDGGNSRYLLAWSDSRNGNFDIYGQLVNASGTLNGTNFAISTAASSQDQPDVAYDASNGRYLAVWLDTRNGGNYDIYGQLINADGTLDAAGDFAIAATANLEYVPDLAYNPVCGNTLVDYTSLTPPAYMGSIGLALVGPPCPAAADSGCGFLIPMDSKALWMVPILLLLLLGIVWARRRA